MFTDSSEFLWERPSRSDGFRIVQTHGGVGRARESFLAPSEDATFESYAPLREASGLFLDFAHVDASDAGILAFANRYGGLTALTGRPSNLKALRHRGVLIPTPDEPGEALADWSAEIGWMAEGVRLWGKVQQGDREAVPLLAERVNERLTGTVSLNLLYDRTAGRPALDILPRDLATAMVLQLAAAVALNKEYRPCRVCGRYFELSPGLNRADRSTCSALCRKRSYRQRMARARKRHAQGKSLREIARELDTNVVTVKKWVLNQKG